MRIGIWGTSKITSFHIDALRQITQVQIVAIHGGHSESGKIISIQNGIPFFHNCEDFLSQKLDVIIITNSVDKHWPSIQAAANMCKTVICEKPIFFNRDQYLRMVTDCGPTNIFVVSQKKYNSDFLKFKKIVRKVENLKQIKIKIKKKRDEVYFAKSGPSKQLVFSQLPHAIDLMWELTSEKLAFDSVVARKIKSHTGFDFIEVRLRGNSLFGIIEIESFHSKNFPYQIIVTTPTQELTHPSLPNFLKRYLPFQKSKRDIIVEEFKLMYLDFFNKISKGQVGADDIITKSDLLTHVVEEINRL